MLLFITHACTCTHDLENKAYVLQNFTIDDCAIQLAKLTVHMQRNCLDSHAVLTII